MQIRTDARGYGRGFEWLDEGAKKGVRMDELAGKTELHHEPGIYLRDTSKLNFVDRFFVWAFAKNTITLEGTTYLVGVRSLAAFRRRNVSLFPSEKVDMEVGAKFDIKKAMQDLTRAIKAKSQEKPFPITPEKITTVYETLGITEPKVQKEMNKELFQGGKEEVTKEAVHDVFSHHRTDIHPRHDVPSALTHLAEALRKDDDASIQKAVNEQVLTEIDEEQAPKVDIASRLRQLEKSQKLSRLNQKTAIRLLHELHGKKETDLTLIILNLRDSLRGQVGADDLLTLLNTLEKRAKGT